MEDEITGQVAAAEAPPGDPPGDGQAAAADAAPAPDATPDAPAGPGAMPDPSDGDAMAAWLDRSEAWINAQATAEERDATHPMAMAPAALAPEAREAAPADPPKAPAPDDAAILEDLQRRGYTVEPPKPPPDPYQQLIDTLVSERGTDEAYAEARQQALVRLPAEPPAYDAESVAAHEAAVKARNEAAERLDRMDQARRITDQAIRFGRDRALGQVGAAFSALPSTYELSPERAARVTTPQSATDAVAAVVEQVTERLNASWQAKFEAEVKKWEGKVAQARSDRSVEAVQRMGRAPQPSGGPAGHPAPVGAPIWATDPKTGLPTEESIQRAIRGDFERVSLG